MGLRRDRIKALVQRAVAGAFFGKLVLEVLPAALASVIGAFLFAHYQFGRPAVSEPAAPATAAVPASAQMVQHRTRRACHNSQLPHGATGGREEPRCCRRRGRGRRRRGRQIGGSSRAARRCCDGGSENGCAARQTDCHCRRSSRQPRSRRCRVAAHRGGRRGAECSHSAGRGARAGSRFACRPDACGQESRGRRDAACGHGDRRYPVLDRTPLRRR